MAELGVCSGNTVMALPAHWYHDPGIWAAERRGIFAREWLWVGRSDRVREPGQVITAEPAGYPILVRRSGDGTLRAFHNVCRHRAMQLVAADASHCRQLVCPYHGWRYADDGELLSAPRFEGAVDFDTADFPLWPVRVHEWLGLVFVCLDEQAPDFNDWFGPLRDRIESYMGAPREFHADLEVEVDCNWKNYVDNYNEGYHLPLVHPRLSQDTEWREYRVHNLPGGCLHEVPPRGAGTQPGLFGWKFPNFIFNTFGSGVSFLRIEPLGPNQIRNVYSHFRPAGMAAEDYERDAVAYGWEVSDEDRALVPLVQRNLEAGVYEAGPLSPRHENGLVHFHDMVRRAVASVSPERVSEV